MGQRTTALTEGCWAEAPGPRAGWWLYSRSNAAFFLSLDFPSALSCFLSVSFDSFSFFFLTRARPRTSLPRPLPPSHACSALPDISTWGSCGARVLSTHMNPVCSRVLDAPPISSLRLFWPRPAAIFPTSLSLTPI